MFAKAKKKKKKEKKRKKKSYFCNQVAYSPQIRQNEMTQEN